ncbi:MAG: hypothetical protein JWO32_1036, partial [Bacteroidetes bacterium]|nr:hypothetical protein [Bacteroidota bacterium]
KAQVLETPSSIENVVTDEERQAYEDAIDTRNIEIKKLKEDLISVKVANANPNKEEKEEAGPVPLNTNALIMELEPEFKACIEKIKEFRVKKFEELSEEDKAEFMPFEKYIKTTLLRGFKRSFNNGMLKSATGINLEDVSLMAKAAGIDYDDDI